MSPEASKRRQTVPSIEAFGADVRFHHVGAVVPRIEDQGLGLAPVEDPIQRVRVAFIDLADTRFELVEPIGPDSPVRHSLEKGGKLLHVCFEVPALESALEAGARHGFRALGPAQPATAFGGRRIAWCYSATFGLVELLERSPEEPSR